MKNNYTTLKACLLLLFLCLCGSSFAQVCLSYAVETSQIYRSNESNFTITGKRITVSDSDHYSMGVEPYTRLGDAIFLNNCQNVVISNCIIGPTGGLGIYLQGCDSVTITNCIFLDNTAAIIAWGSSKVKINNNQFINVQNINPIGTPHAGAGGYVQLRLCSGGGSEIKDNVGENVLMFSNPEDMINVSRSSFDAGRPLIISGNKFRGGGPSHSGGGINIGDDLGLSPITENVIVYNNKLVDPGQYGIITGNGNGIRIDGNQVYARHQDFTNVGMAATDYYSSGLCNNPVIVNNQVNYTGNWPLYSGTPVYNPFWTDYTCGALSTVWTDNDFSSTIDETILPERLLCPVPMAYLKFDNNLNDYSGSNLHATAYGSASVVCDTYRKAASFNGTSSDVMTLPKSVWLKPSTQMISVSAWIKPSALSNIQGYIRSQDANGWDDGWRGVMDNGDFVPQVVTNNGRVSVYCSGVSSGTWNHVVFTYDGKTLKGYINGSLVNSASLASNIIYNTSSNLAIGGSEGTYNFGGMIAEVAIYNGVLSSTDIANEYSSKIGFFDGSATNLAMNIQAEYSANGQSKYLNSYGGVYPNSSGVIYATATTSGSTTYQWQLLSGSPNYANFYGQWAYVSIPSGDYANLRITVQEYCALTGTRDFLIYGSYAEPFNIKLIPGSNNLVVTKPPVETTPSNGNRLIPGIKNQPALSKGTYTVQVVNMLGQVIKTGNFQDGLLTLNISNAAAGVYVVRVMNKFGIVYTEKVIKW